MTVTPLPYNESPIPRGRPQPIAEVLSDLIARRGYAREQSSAACDEAWRQAAGEMLARHTRCGQVRRGKLEVIVANSILMQEITFQKSQILASLKQHLPELNITDLKLKVGVIN
jgi:predicted nucleic acid-binding Zn ribbon protein